MFSVTLFNHQSTRDGDNWQGGGAPVLGCPGGCRHDGASCRGKQFRGVLGAGVQRGLGNIECLWVQQHPVWRPSGLLMDIHGADGCSLQQPRLHGCLAHPVREPQHLRLLRIRVAEFLDPVLNYISLDQKIASDTHQLEACHPADGYMYEST